MKKTKNNVSLVRAIAVTAVMGAVGAVLMALEFPLPIIPSFIKLDFSELPALLASFALGPIWGGAVCLLKNLLHLFFGSSMGVGELANFILGAVFTVTAGIIYQRKKTRAGALIGSLAGSVLMGAVSVALNYFVVYPLYGKVFGLTTDVIVSMYKAILPAADNLIKALLIFNVPFTIAKGIICSILCFAIYKPMRPLLKGRQ